MEKTAVKHLLSRSRTSTSITIDWFLYNCQDGIVLPNSCKKSRQSVTFGWFPFNQLIHRFQFYSDSCVNFCRIDRIPFLLTSVLFKIHISVSIEDDFEMTREMEAIWTTVESSLKVNWPPSNSKSFKTKLVSAVPFVTRANGQKFMNVCSALDEIKFYFRRL